MLCSYSANENRQKQGLPNVGTSREVGSETERNWEALLQY